METTHPLFETTGKWVGILWPTLALPILAISFYKLMYFFWTTYILVSRKVQKQNPIFTVEKTTKFQFEINIAWGKH